jgi:hypothetical protein
MAEVMINACGTSRPKVAVACKGRQMCKRDAKLKKAFHLHLELPAVASSDSRFQDAPEARLAARGHDSQNEELGAKLCAELADMEHGVLHSTSGRYSVQLTGGAKGFLLEKAQGLPDGGLHMKIVIDHYIIRPLTNLLFAGQIGPEALVLVDWRADKKYLTFARTPAPQDHSSRLV